MMKYFVVSDVHNCYTLLKTTLLKEGFDEQNDNHKLIICGDAFVYGEEAGAMYDYLKHLKSLHKLIYVYGNHEIELLEGIEKNRFKPVERKTIKNILDYNHINNSDLDDEALSERLRSLGFDTFLKDTLPYYELDNYIFIHGYIPTSKHLYIPTWRESDDQTFKNATRSDAMMLSLKYGIKEPGKTIVCGHYSAARAYLMKNATAEDWEKRIYTDVSNVPLEGFKTCFTDGVIFLDPSIRKSGLVNCLMIEK